MTAMTEAPELEQAPQQELPLEQPETIEINDLDDFVRHLVRWHSNRVATMEHMLQVPEGVEMQLDGGASVPLTGDLLAGFKAGINLSLMQFGCLPFAFETEPAAPQAEG